MPQGKDLSVSTASEIKALINHTTLSQREIARRFNVSVSTVNKIAHEQHPVEERGRRIGRCGRKRKLTEADERYLIREVKKHPATTLPKLQQHLADSGTHVHQTTISRRLKTFGCKSVKPRRVPLLTAAMKKKRLDFAREHQHWTAQDWERVRF